MCMQFVGRFHSNWQNISKLQTLKEPAGNWMCNPARRVDASLFPFSSIYTCSHRCTCVHGSLLHHYLILQYHYLIWGINDLPEIHSTHKRKTLLILRLCNHQVFISQLKHFNWFHCQRITHIIQIYFYQPSFHLVWTCDLYLVLDQEQVMQPV